MSISDVELATPEQDFAETSNPRPEWFLALLKYVDPGCSVPVRNQVIAAVHRKLPRPGHSE